MRRISLTFFLLFGGMAVAQETWNFKPVGTKANLNSISCPSASVCYAAGDSGVVLKTSNGGVDWTRQNIGMMESVLSVAFLNANDGYSLTTNGRLLKTSDGGDSWEHPADSLAFS